MTKENPINTTTNKGFSFKERVNKKIQEIKGKDSLEKQEIMQKKQKEVEKIRSSVVEVKQSQAFEKLKNILNSDELREILKTYFDSFFDPKYNKLPFDKALLITNYFDKDCEGISTDDEETNIDWIRRLFIKDRIVKVANISLEVGTEHDYGNEGERSWWLQSGTCDYELSINLDSQEIYINNRIYDEWLRDITVEIAQNEIKKGIKQQNEEKQRIQAEKDEPAQKERLQRLNEYKEMLFKKDRHNHSLLNALGISKEIHMTWQERNDLDKFKRGETYFPDFK